MPELPPVTMATLPERSGLSVAMTSAAVDFFPSLEGALMTRPRVPRNQANIMATSRSIDCTRVAALTVADWTGLLQWLWRPLALTFYVQLQGPVCLSLLQECEPVWVQNHTAS